MQVSVSHEPRLPLSDRLTRSTTAGVITLYQRYISPHKGFRCAHRVYHGGQSCSAYAKTAVQSHGLGAAIPLIRQRFADCSQAANMVRSQSTLSVPKSSFDCSKEERRQQSANCWADAACDCATYGCPNPEIDGCALLDGCDTGAGGCDGCGEIDLGGCDGCDVGGCDF